MKRLLLVVVLALCMVGSATAAQSALSFTTAQFIAISHAWTRATQGANVRHCNYLAGRMAIHCVAYYATGYNEMYAIRSGYCGLRFRYAQNGSPQGPVKVIRHYFC